METITIATEQYEKKYDSSLHKSSLNDEIMLLITCLRGYSFLKSFILI